MTPAALKSAALRLVPARKDVLSAALRLAVAGALGLAGAVLANATALLAAKLFAVMGTFGLLYQAEKAGGELVGEVLARLFARRQPSDDEVWWGGGE